MRPKIVRLLFGLVVVVAGSCSSSPSSVGSVRQPCYANGTCNAGLQCFSMVCVNATDGGAAGAGGAAAGAGGASAGAGGASAGTGGASAGAGGASAGAGGASAGTSGDAGTSGNAGTGGHAGTGAGAAGAGGAAATPPIAGLTIWLDGSKGVTAPGGPVIAWADQSASGENATGMNSTAPTLTAGAVNGHDAIHFSGANASTLTVTAGSGIEWGTSSFLLELVVRRTSPTSQATFWSQGTSQTNGLFFTGETDFEFSPATGGESTTDFTIDGGATAYNDGGVHSVGVRRDPSSLDKFSLLVDGAVVASQLEDGLSVTNGSVATIGPFDGDLFEIVGKNGAVTDADVAAVESYFHTKYGTP